MMKKITFLHTADLHLDSPMVGLSHLPEKMYKKLLNSTFSAFRRVVDTAIENQVDFLIIAGDIYDGEDRSIRAQVRFRSEMERLQAANIPVYITHGNHDHLSGSWTQISLPSNVIVFGKEVEIHTFLKDNVTVHLYGFSYPTRQVLERKIEDYQKISGADFHIGILHGNDGGSSSHGNYAPFHVQDLVEKQFDYWALGHIHKGKILSESPPIVYPGNIQGRHHKEDGPKGCYLVSLSETNYQLSWIETTDIEWNTVEIDSSLCNSFQEVYQLCTDKLNEMRNNHAKGKLIKLVINNLKAIEGKDSLINGELLEILQENEVEEESFIWVTAIQFKEKQNDKKETLKSEDGFFMELYQIIDDYNQLDKAIEPLYQHYLARKYISNLNDEEKREMLTEAERILIDLLFEKS
ncbi:exonuclease SbcCD subunit D [Bacillus sp. CGMCC 1.16607]|uniref:metallophosphoesterase family protein n=1 Tax=Bacillus sp. CGMCC 1.16607 TaxID=3351842 RepID=UPI00363E9F88